MNNLTPPLSRRQALAGSLTAATGLLLTSQRPAPEAQNQSGRAPAPRDRALIAITLDLEMSRNFPTWDQTHWDYEKGNLNAATKRYTVEACRRVRAHGGVIHCFALGQTMEQEDVSWLQGIRRAGHPIGNHTYDHVHVKARRLPDIQFRFQRCPWLIEGQRPEQVIRENIRLAGIALRTRLGGEAVGFRTPGGFADGLRDRPDLQRMLRDLGFRWVSSLYPAHAHSPPGRAPGPAVFDSIVAAQRAAQPFRYASGLVEVPMSPVSDITAFRGGRWRLEWFLEALRRAVEGVIARRAVFDFLAHPSCLYVVDPEFRAIELICDLVRRAGERAAFADLSQLAERAAS
jgi:peptidoglycan/xylan/chitin deacetylase (PgdA/CDA1 family)